MNGYELLASSYRSLLERGKITEEEATKKIRIFDFLTTCDKEDIYTLVRQFCF